MVSRIVLVAVVVGSLAGCGGSEPVGKGQDVVAAFYPLAYAAEQVAPAASVTNLTPAGVEPHDLELSPREVQRVREADRVLYLGAGFMPALEDAVQSQDGAVDLLRGEDLRRAQAGEGGATGLDPHLWLDPLRYAGVVRRIAAALGPPASAKALTAKLEDLDRELRLGLTRCARRQIVTSHAAFGYLARRYGLTQVALTGLSPEAEPSPRALEDLVRRTRRSGATTVFFETLVSPRLARTVAREAGATAAVLDPLEGLTEDRASAGADYFSVMRDNLAALRKALGCR